LGATLVKELGLEDSHDTLGRWMASYISELMVKAKNAPKKEKAQAEKECFEAILTLWSQREEVTERIQPLAALKPALELLSRLAHDTHLSWELYLYDNKDPWRQFGTKIHDNSQWILRLLMVLQTLPVDFVNMAKWKEKHSVHLADEERQAIGDLDEIVNKTNHYFGLEAAAAEPHAAIEKIIRHIGECIDGQVKAFEKLKAALPHEDPNGTSAD